MPIKRILTFCRNRNGSVTVIGGIALPALVGFAALVAEFGHGLVTKTENQRIADEAAYAAAVAYGSTSSTAVATSVAQKVAALNGVAAASVTTSLVTSPRSASSQAVLVKISTTNVLLLAPVLGFGTSLPVSAKAYAQVGAAAPACMLALSAGGSGVTLTGGTSISAPSCAVASNTTVSVPCGDTITAQSVIYNTTAPSVGCSGGITGSISKASTPDPLASNTGIQTASAHAASLTSLAGPNAPSIATGQDIAFGYSQSATQAQATAAHCAATFSGSTWTLTCPSGSTYAFGNITLSGGITVNFNTAGTAATTYNFSGSIANSGTALTFGAGTYNIAKGVTTGGGTTTTFGAGTFNIGPGTSTCSSAGLYSICNTGTTLTFGGPSTFNLSAGLYNAGGSKLVLGSGTTNSFNIGAASDGNAIYVGGGATTTFADATGAGDLFQLSGNFNEGGGACTTISAATQHDLKGYVSTAGGLMLGAGVYSVTSYIAFGASGGGDVSCNGTNVGVAGSGVTLVTAGLGTMSGGNCSGDTFCMGSGFNNVTISAPTSGTYANLVIIGSTSSSNTGGALFTDGASNTTLAGAVYFPYGPLSLAGGASVGNQAGQCLQIVATQIALSGGTKATAASCFSGSGSGTSSASLVQ